MNGFPIQIDSWHTNKTLMSKATRVTVCGSLCLFVRVNNTHNNLQEGRTSWRPGGFRGSLSSEGVFVWLGVSFTTTNNTTTKQRKRRIASSSEAKPKTAPRKLRLHVADLIRTDHYGDQICGFQPLGFKKQLAENYSTLTKSPLLSHYCLIRSLSFSLIRFIYTKN